MSEEIIIDEVNVKDCPHRNLDCSIFMNIIKCYNYGICEGQNCLYKQLQKSKEENTDLIKRLDIADKKLTIFSRELEQANKENERLKEEINKLATKLEKIIKICEEAIRLCDCLDADANYDCIDCTEGGRASLAKEITRVLKDEYN